MTRRLTDGERDIWNEMQRDAAPGPDDFEPCACPRCGDESQTLKGEEPALCDSCYRHEVENER